MYFLLLLAQAPADLWCSPHHKAELYRIYADECEVGLEVAIL